MLPQPPYFLMRGETGATIFVSEAAIFPNVHFMLPTLHSDFPADSNTDSDAASHATSKQPELYQESNERG